MEDGEGGSGDDESVAAYTPSISATDDGIIIIIIMIIIMIIMIISIDYYY